MSVEEHIRALRAKHADLEGQIVQETSRPLPDQIAIVSLKKQKLKIKDELARLSPAIA
ncbi:MAG TPA: YdcH family protein [Alphaproteobacteria bacterium]|jgi:hypothetical protein